jgi:ribonuclease HI
MSDDNPIKIAAQSDKRSRLQSVNMWREQAKQTIAEAGLDSAPRQSAVLKGAAPWSIDHRAEFRDSLVDPIKRNDDDEKKRLAAETTINSLPRCDVRMWTDGSAEKGTYNGGSGVYIEWIDRGTTSAITQPAGKWCSSYLAEMKALLAATTWVSERVADIGPQKRVIILSDSKSSIQKLRSGPCNQTDFIGQRIWKKLLSPELAGLHFIFQWVPAHCGVAGNEVVDQLANQGRGHPQDNEPVDIATATSVLSRATKEKWKRQSGRNVLAFSTNYQKERVLSRQHRRVLAQLRAKGHCPLLKSYQMRIGLADTDTCRFCALGVETVEHILVTCPALQRARMDYLGGWGELSMLATDPVKVVNFLVRTGVIPR